MKSSTAAFVVLLCTAGPLAAQSSLPVRAFPRSAGATIGLSSFGTRSSNAGGASFSYKGSLVISGRLDEPLTRRTGLLLSVGIAPLSQQRGEGSVSTVLADKLMVGIADAALGFRFKPSAPVFFMAGGGLTYATLPPVPDTRGGVREPHALLGVGYDTKSSDAWSIRSVFANRIVFPADDDDAATRGKSRAHDWTIEVGARYMFGKTAAR